MWVAGIKNTKFGIGFGEAQFMIELGTTWDHIKISYLV